MSYNPPPKQFVPSDNNSNTVLTVQLDNSVDQFIPSMTSSIFVNARIKSVDRNNNNNSNSNNTTPATRPPIHITVCQDVSGSLAGEKLNMCKHSLNFIVDKLSGKDRFGLVTFGSRVREVVPLIEMTEKVPTPSSASASRPEATLATMSSSRFGGSVSALTTPSSSSSSSSSLSGSTLSSIISGKESAKRSIYEIEAGGNTALAGGLMMALKQEPFIVASSSPSSPSSQNPTAIVSHSLTKKRQQQVNSSTTHNALLPNDNTKIEYLYTITITPPAMPSQKILVPSTSAVECTHFEVSAGGQGDKVITASGESEFELPPLDKPLDKIKITFFMSTNPESFYTVECPIGDTLLKKQHLILTAANQNVNHHQTDQQQNGSNAAALTVVSAALRPVRAILLFTDGNMNTGNVSANTLKRDVQQALDTYQRAKGTRPLLFTFGFGNETNASLLRDLAQLTQFSFYHMNNASHIPRVFADVLGSLFSIVSQNVKLFIRPNLPCGVRIGRILCGNLRQEALAEEAVPVADASQTRPKTDLRARGDTLSIAQGHRNCYEINVGNIFQDEAKDVLIECEFAEGFPAHKYPTVFAPVEFILQYRTGNDIPSVTCHSSAIPVDFTAITNTNNNRPQKRNDLVESVYHRFRTQETLDEVRNMAERGAMKQAQEHAVNVCKRLEDILAEIRLAERLERESGNINTTRGGSASTTTSGSSATAHQHSRETVEKCLSQVNHVALTAVSDVLQYTVAGGAQTVNAYANELGVQRNNNAYGVGGGDVGERARSLFEINATRKKMREEVAARF